MDFLYYPIAFLVVIGVLVAIHEYGHYVVARWSGVHVLKFSIGFGRVLWSRRDVRGTEFALSAIPLGGFVRMYDEREELGDEHPIPPNARSYTQLHPAWRIAIALGGPLANLILAVVIAWGLFVAGDWNYLPVTKAPLAQTPLGQALSDAGLGSFTDDEGETRVGFPLILTAVDGRAVGSFQQAGLRLTDRLGETGSIAMRLAVPDRSRIVDVQIPIERWHEGVGEPDVIRSLGIQGTQLAVVGGVVAGKPGERGGLQADDWIRAVDGEPVADWFELVGHIEANPGTTLSLNVTRAGGSLSLQVTPEGRLDGNGVEKGFLGIELQRVLEQYGALEAIPRAFADTWDKTLLIFSTVKKIVTGSVSVKNLSGPVTIAQVAGDSAQYSLRAFLFIMGFLSVSLGVFNLLPIPMLDGGQVVYNASEWIMGRPVPERIQILGVQIGLFLIGILFVVVMYNDVLRLLG